MVNRLNKLLEQYQLLRVLDTMVSRMKRHELITVLMAIHSRRAAQHQPRQVMQQFETDRFVTPSAVPQRIFLRFDTVAFDIAKTFQAVELSPLAPEGICSVVAPVDQRWVIGTHRLQEVVSDCTNVLAAIAAKERKEAIRHGRKGHWVRLCTSHRHTRAQKFDHPLFSAHFRVFALVTAGRDAGGLHFEKESVSEQIRTYVKLLRAFDTTKKMPISLSFYTASTQRQVWEQWARQWDRADIVTNFKDEILKEEGYYWPLRFQMRLMDDDPIDLIDGGFVDWSRKYLSDRKERMLISGMGTELFCKTFLADSENDLT